MSTQVLNATLEPRFTRKQRKLLRRLAMALLLALALHAFFFFILLPYFEMQFKTKAAPTEVVQISPEQLKKMKQDILKNNRMSPLLEQELREQYKTKEAPKNAKFIAPFNQSVPEETVAGAQQDAPKQGGGAATKTQQKPVQKQQPADPLSLSKLGLGSNVAPPLPAEALPQGGMGPSIPVGRDDPKLKRSGVNMLNAVENKYYSFFVRFEDPIIRNWFFMLRSYESKMRAEMVAQKIGEGAELPVTLEFEIDHSGNFRSISIVQSSGISTLDWATREAVRKLGSIPNPPPDIFEGAQTFKYRIQFMVYLSGDPNNTPAPGMNWY